MRLYFAAVSFAIVTCCVVVVWTVVVNLGNNSFVF